jgi:metal-responsive CopG/Arc/MetJ family transcriptional regulator
MRVKTSITMTSDLLAALDQEAGPYKNRSEFIEAAVRAFIQQRRRADQNARDALVIDRRADALNREAVDVLGYQTPL